METILLKGDFRDKPAQVSFSDIEVNSADQLADCILHITTNDYCFWTQFCIDVDFLVEFLSQIQNVIDSNTGKALLQSYTEESQLVFTALGTPSGRILIEGTICVTFPTIDGRLYGHLADAVGHIRSGINIHFGGVETDQSYVGQLVSALKLLSKALRKGVVP